jgi:hypothetical protein
MNSRNRFGRVDEAAIPTRATNGEKGRNCFINSAPFAWAALTSARGSMLEARVPRHRRIEQKPERMGIDVNLVVVERSPRSVMLSHPKPRAGLAAHRGVHRPIDLHQERVIRPAVTGGNRVPNLRCR